MVRGYGFGFAGDEVMPPVSSEAWEVLQLGLQGRNDCRHARAT